MPKPLPDLPASRPLGARACAWLAVVALAAAGLSVPGALAQHGSARTFRVAWTGGTARVSVRADDLVDVGFQRRLTDGLAHVVTTRVLAHPARQSDTIARAGRRCRVSYDAWLRSFSIDDGSTGTSRGASLGDVLSRCVDVDALELRGADGWATRSGGHVWLDALTELDPTSAESVHRLRAWLEHPDGGAEPRSPFGSCVALFVTRQLGAPARSLRYRSRDDVAVP